MAQFDQPYQDPRRKGWTIRWRERETETGEWVRKSKSGFATKSAARSYRDNRTGIRNPELRVRDLLDRFLNVYNASEARRKKVEWAFEKAKDALGGVKVETLTKEEIDAWKRLLPESHRWDVVQAFIQAFRWAEASEIIVRNPARHVTNPAPRAKEKLTFESWEEVEAVAEEIGEWGPLVIFATATGLRPGEWVALERSAIDRKAKQPVVNVTRRLTQDGNLGPPKNGRSRQVPLTPRALAALDALPPRLDTPLAFPGKRGRYLNERNWLRRDWRPALDAAGLAPRSPYAMRHTFATMALRAGLPTFHVARLMGTSVEMIERYYGHLTRDAHEWHVQLLGEFESESFGRIVDAQDGAK